MTRIEKLQTIGPLALCLAVIGAEMAASALALRPSTEWLWYLNVNIFNMFQQTHYLITAFLGIDQPETVLIVLPIGLLAALGLIFKQRLLLALSTNFSFVYVGAVAYYWVLSGPMTPVASLSPSGLEFHASAAEPNLALLLGLAALTLISFLASHIFYIRKSRILS